MISRLLLPLSITSLILLQHTASIPTIVQTLSSRFALVLGGFGPGYTELQEVEVVKHGTTCTGAVAPVPPALARFLGDVSGLAEFVDDKVIFCRHASCWALKLPQNTWNPIAPLHQERDQAASVALAGAMVVLGGRTPLEGELSNELEMWNSTLDTWQPLPHLAMEEARFSFCATPVNETALMVLGGWGAEGALDSVQVLDLETGRWEDGPSLPSPRYGHTCLLTEVAGTRGIMVAGGALAGKQVDFLDLATSEWRQLPSLNYKIDGHKLILVEGIPTMFSWENIEMFDGKSWVLQPHRLSSSRSAFTVTSVPGHLLPQC